MGRAAPVLLFLRPVDRHAADDTDGPEPLPQQQRPGVIDAIVHPDAAVRPRLGPGGAAAVRQCAEPGVWRDGWFSREPGVLGAGTNRNAIEPERLKSAQGQGAGVVSRYCAPPSSGSGSAASCVSG